MISWKRPIKCAGKGETGERTAEHGRDGQWPRRACWQSCMAAFPLFFGTSGKTEYCLFAESVNRYLFGTPEEDAVCVQLWRPFPDFSVLPGNGVSSVRGICGKVLFRHLGERTVIWELEIHGAASVGRGSLQGLQKSRKSRRNRDILRLFVMQTFSCQVYQTKF